MTIADEADSDSDGLVSDESTETVTTSTTNTGSFITGSASQDTVALQSSGTDAHEINLMGANDEITGANTVAADDILEGGAGTDTLNYGANAADLTGLTTVTGFEVVEVNGAQTVTLDDENIDDAGGSVTINETGANAAVTVSAAVSAGKTVILGEAASYTLANVVGNRVTIADEADSDSDGLVSDESTETVTTSTTNTGSIITGSASQDTVALQSSGTAAHNINLGGAADEITGMNNVGTDDVLEGGAGTDTLNYGGNAATSLA